METPDEAATMEGTASSSSGIVSVSWVNDRGGQGIAEGTESWTTGSIALELGDNAITVTAEDSEGETASRTVVIKRETGDPGSVTLSWMPPTTRDDGSPLTNLAGFIVHYGRMPGVYDFTIDIDNPGVATHVVENLQSGTWYFAVSAYDSDELESNLSNETSADVL